MKRKLNTNKYSGPPEQWMEAWDAIEKVRARTPAAVDTMGCHKLHDPEAEERVQRYQALVALMLSSQTKDETTAAAMQVLRAYGLTPERIDQETTEEQLNEMICKVGFHNKKAVYIKKATRVLFEQYGGDIPPTVEKMQELPGVGPKMAYLLVQVAWGRTDGIGVDVHVHRIAKRLGWTDPEQCKTPEDTRFSLQSWLPKDRWEAVNPLLVGLGQTVCRPLHPVCESCDAAPYCKFGSTVSRLKKPKKE